MSNAELIMEKAKTLPDTDAKKVLAYIDFLLKEQANLVPDEELFTASDKLMEENRKVYEVLAK